MVLSRPVLGETKNVSNQIFLVRLLVEKSKIEPDRTDDERFRLVWFISFNFF